MTNMRDVYLIGVNHKYQLGPDGAIPVDAPPEAFIEFRRFLMTTIAGNGIRGIAEEMSRFALKKHFISGESVPCRLADEIGLPHRYCDPDGGDRKMREPYWIKELIAFNTFPTLFILGADHIDSLARLLADSDFQPFVVARDWEPSLTAKDAV
jgi:hypothetical protein